MDERQRSANKGRETVLTICLVMILGGAFLFFLNLVSLGIFFYVGAAMTGMTIVGYLHYLLWGHSMAQQVAGEREEAELDADMKDRYSDDTPRYHP